MIDLEFRPDRIKAVRVAHGLTQAQLAAQLGTTQAVISQWETGLRTAPTHRKFVALLLKLESDAANG